MNARQLDGRYPRSAEGSHPGRPPDLPPPMTGLTLIDRGKGDMLPAAPALVERRGAGNLNLGQLHADQPFNDLRSYACGFWSSVVSNQLIRRA